MHNYACTCVYIYTLYNELYHRINKHVNTLTCVCIYIYIYVFIDLCRYIGIRYMYVSESMRVTGSAAGISATSNRMLRLL